LALWAHGRRRAKTAASEDQALFKLTPDEEARLERLIDAEPRADKPV
jgi:cytochrome c-type biogenesis protein CcmH